MNENAGTGVGTLPSAPGIEGDGGTGGWPTCEGPTSVTSELGIAPYPPSHGPENPCTGPPGPAGTPSVPANIGRASSKNPNPVGATGIVPTPGAPGTDPISGTTGAPGPHGAPPKEGPVGVGAPGTDCRTSGAIARWGCGTNCPACASATPAPKPGTAGAVGPGTAA